MSFVLKCWRRLAVLATSTLPLLGVTPTAFGQLQVTELMVDSLSANDDAWEWIEIRNTGATPVDLNGYIFDRLGDEQFVATSIDSTKASTTVIPAGAVAVIYDGNHPLAAADYNDNLFRAAWGLSANVTLIAADNFPALTNGGGTSFGLWPDAVAYNADLANTDEDEDLEVASYNHATLSFDFRTAGGFPAAPGGVSITWSGQGDYTNGANWAPTASGATSVLAAVPGNVNSPNDIANPGVYPGGTPGNGLYFTEIMYNPASSDNQWEWVEVFNNTGATIDFGANPAVFDDDDDSVLTGANVISGAIADGTGAILFNASSSGITASSMQAAWDPDGTRGLNFIPITPWSTALGNSGDRFALWPSFDDYATESSTASQTRTMNNALAVGLFDDDSLGVPGASGTWPVNDNSGSIYLTDFNADPTVGDNWALSLDGDGVSFYASAIAGTITIHPGGELGTPGEFIVGPAPTDADFDDNGLVDGNDFLIWQRNLGTGSSNTSGDADGNGNVDAQDLAAWKAAFGSTTTAAAVGVVPEPVCAIFALMGGAALVAAGRRRC